MKYYSAVKKKKKKGSTDRHKNLMNLLNYAEYNEDYNKIIIR